MSFNLDEGLREEGRTSLRDRLNAVYYGTHALTSEDALARFMRGAV